MSTHSSILAWKIPWIVAWWATVQGVAEESHGPLGLNNHNIRWNCVLIDWWIWWIWLHQIFLASRGIFRWGKQILSHHTGTLYLGRWTLSCGMWALIPWWRTKCWARPLEPQSLSHWSSEEVPELVLLWLGMCMFPNRETFLIVEQIWYDWEYVDVLIKEMDSPYIKVT